MPPTPTHHLPMLSLFQTPSGSLSSVAPEVLDMRGPWWEEDLSPQERVHGWQWIFNCPNDWLEPRRWGRDYPYGFRCWAWAELKMDGEVHPQWSAPALKQELSSAAFSLEWDFRKITCSSEMETWPISANACTPTLQHYKLMPIL